MKLKNPGQRSKTGCTKSAGCVGVESRPPKNGAEVTAVVIRRTGK